MDRKDNGMKLLRRRTKREKLLDSTADVVAGAGVRQAAKMTLGVVGGAVATIAASAAISTARRQEQR